MNHDQTERFIALLERIAGGLEAEVHTNHDPEQMDRLLSVQERAVAAAEEHNRHHRDQGLPPAEGRIQ